MLSKGQAPSRDAFGTTPKEIIQRFLQYLGANEKRDLLLASYLERVDEALFHTLAETFLGGAAVVNLAQLKRRSVLEEDSQGHLSLHALMRQALQDQEKNERPELYERIHRFLFEYFDQKAAVQSARDINERSVTALLETLPHAMALGTEEFGTWLFERVEHYSTAGEYQVLQSVFEQSLLVFAENTWQYANSASWLANTQMTLGHLDQAEAMYYKALKINEALEFREGMAIQYSNLGVLYKTRGQFDQAENMHHNALKMHEALGHSQGMASNYSNLGLLHQARGELDQTEEMHHKALKIHEALGRQEGMANQYGNLGIVYKDRGERAEARRHWLLARDLFAELGSPNEQTVQGWIDALDVDST